MKRSHYLGYPQGRFYTKVIIKWVNGRAGFVPKLSSNALTIGWIFTSIIVKCDNGRAGFVPKLSSNGLTVTLNPPLQNLRYFIISPNSTFSSSATLNLEFAHPMPGNYWGVIRPFPKIKDYWQCIGELPLMLFHDG